MKTKNIDFMVAPNTPHFVGDGFRVHNFIPGVPKMDMQSMDPFIMMDYNSKYNFPPSETPKGVGVHPHKGFETVTIAYKGKVEHHDSSGGGGIIGEGEVQWMTAGKGVLHKEFHEKEWSKTGGEFQMVQLWVNLPKKDKNTDPKYQAVTRENIERVELPENAGTIEVIAGEYNGVKGTASTFTPIHMMNAKLKKGGKAEFTFPENYTTTLLIIEGNVIVNGKDEIPTDHLALMSRNGEKFEIEASEDAVILVLSGEPINEPIAAQGPFVMNTREELIEAFQEFNEGKFGELN